jgi:hypothetical protein
MNLRGRAASSIADASARRAFRPAAAFAIDLDRGAVDQQMQRLVTHDAYRTLYLAFANLWRRSLLNL